MRPVVFYARKQVLVTGSTGHLATNLIAALAQVDCRIVRLSRPGAVFPPVQGRAEIRAITGEIDDPATWRQVMEGTDVVFHLAACTSYASNENPAADLSVNFAPMVHLLEAIRQSGRQVLVLHAGTVTQTGFPTRLPVDESHPDNPMTIYDLHKQMAENYLKYYTMQDVVRGAVLRLANVYGPGPKSSSAERGLLNIMVRRALAGDSLTIYGEGNYLRDFVYVDDVVDAFLLSGVCLATQPARINGRHFVIGSGKGYTIAESIRLVADRIALKTGRRAPIIHIPPPKPLLPIEARDFVADPGAIADATGWRAQISLYEGIDRTIDSYSTR